MLKWQGNASPIDRVDTIASPPLSIISPTVPAAVDVVRRCLPPTPPQSFAAVDHRRPSPPSPSPYDAPPDFRQRPPHICVMPAIGATAPFDLEAKARVEQGFSRRLEQPRRVTPPPPSFGGSGGCPVWYRELQLERFHMRGR
jgi:hypothetical protein